MKLYFPMIDFPFDPEVYLFELEWYRKFGVLHKTEAKFRSSGKNILGFTEMLLLSLAYGR